MSTSKKLSIQSDVSDDILRVLLDEDVNDVARRDPFSVNAHRKERIVLKAQDIPDILRVVSFKSSGSLGHIHVLWAEKNHRKLRLHCFFDPGTFD